MLSYSFFFFQAEDGIRDYKVTGVQTCALPIYVSAHLTFPGLFQDSRARSILSPAKRESSRSVGTRHAKGRCNPMAYEVRSEERRVGKEVGGWEEREGEGSKTNRDCHCTCAVKL